MNIDNLTDDQIRVLEAQNKSIGKFRPLGVHPDRVNIDSMDDDQIRTLEAQARRYEPGPSGIHPDRVTLESMSYDQIRTLEAQRNRYEPGPSGIHPDRVTIESMSDDQIRTLEAQARRYEPGPSGIHPDRVTIDSMDDDQIKTIEAQVFARKQTDIPFNQYLDSLVDSPVIEDEQQFLDAVMRSMQSNSVMERFINKLTEKIGQKVFDFKSIDKNDKAKVEAAKKEIEQLISLYQKFLYTLKANGWNFQTIGLGVEGMKLDDSVSMGLWRIQKNYDIEFKLPIPADLGEDYGKAFEREAKMVPGLTMMYDDLRGREVNWHQVMNYHPGELTPSQRYKQRREERMRKFEQARQTEMQTSLEKSMAVQGMVR